MAAVTATLSSRVDARGMSEILLRFVGGRDHIYRLHSALYIKPAFWNEKGHCVSVPRLEVPERPGLLELQAKLSNLSIHLIERFAGADKSIVDRRWMQKAVNGFHHPETEGSGCARLVDAFTLFRQHSEPKVSEDRMARYKVVGLSLARWERYRGATILLDSVDKDDLRDFDNFITNEYKLAKDRRWKQLYADAKEAELPRERSRNTVVEYLCVLRTFYHWAKREGLTTVAPFDTFQIDSAIYGTPYYISVEEVDQLYKADLSARPQLAIQRDIFVFQCQVGCRVGDLLRFRQSDVSGGVLEYIPGKTRGEKPRTVRVPLNARAREILERYKAEAYPRLLPFISSQNYNDAIKDAFRLAGLTRTVTVLDPLTRKEVKRPLNEVASSHLARRTFIGNLYKKVKDPNLIASMSGHVEGSKAFARYRTIDDDMKAELVDLLG